MPNKKKKFIDKKKSITFHLVHRSQQDPLVADETAPQHVLVPISGKNKENSDKNKQIEEQHKYGIYFDDDYNYLQHLKTTNETSELSEDITAINLESKLQLPSSVFASSIQENVGLLHKAAPQSGPRPDLDPDVIAALDDDFDFENPDNVLEDDFIQLANGTGDFEEEEDRDLSSDYEDYGSEDLDDDDEENAFHYDRKSKEDTKSQFTDYSITSSVLRRNEHLALLDKQFEKAYSDYNDTEIGALDCDEIEGFISENSEILLQYASEFEKQNRKNMLKNEQIINNRRLTQINEDESENEEDDLIDVQVKDEMKWDCESILTTNSNIYNHPKLIKEPRSEKIKINISTGMPINVLGQNKLTKANLSKLNDVNGVGIEKYGKSKSILTSSIISNLSTLSIRPKDETADEKSKRKKQLKEYRKERRIEKKSNKIAFKDESKRQTLIAINLRKNVSNSANKID